MKNIKGLIALVTLVTVSVASAYYDRYGTYQPTLRERLTGDTPEVIEAKDKAAIEHQEAQQKANIQQQEAQQKANIKYKKKNVEIQAKKEQGKFRRY